MPTNLVDRHNAGRNTFKMMKSMSAKLKSVSKN